MKRWGGFKKIIGVMVACSFVLSACNPMSREQESNAEWESFLKELDAIAPNEVETHIAVDVSEHFSVDADIVFPETLEDYYVNELFLKRHLFTEKKDKLQDLIIYTGWTGLSEPQERITDDPLENGEKVQAISTNGDIGFIQVRDSYLLINATEAYKYSEWLINPFSGKTGDRYYFGFMEPDVELEFASVEEKKQETERLFEMLDVEYMDVDVYSCDFEYLQSIKQMEEAYYDMCGLENEADWTISEEDEAYFVIINQGYNGIPLFPYSLSSTVTNSSHGVGSQCSAIFTADGIQDFTVYNVFDTVEVGEKEKILSLADILEKHYERSSNRLAAFETEEEAANYKERVTEVQLYYLPVCVDRENMEFTAKPVWYVLSNIGSEYDPGEEVVYDAVTGEELPWHE